MKAFISYSTKDKKYGATVKSAMAEIGIESFLAHDDLRVSEEWAERILVELKRCEIFTPLLSDAFRNSDWCGQETGIVVRRRAVLIIPLSIDGTMPYGFISHIQCQRIPASGLDPDMLLHAVAGKWPSLGIDILLDRVDRRAKDFRDAEKTIEPVVPYFKHFSNDQATRFARMAVDNAQIWLAKLCRERYLPEFLKTHSMTIPPSLFKALKYQVEKQEWSK
jgi:hypothetical protein